MLKRGNELAGVVYVPPVSLLDCLSTLNRPIPQKSATVDATRMILVCPSQPVCWYSQRDRWPTTANAINLNWLRNAPAITHNLLIATTHNGIQGAPLGSEIVHCTIIQMAAELEQWMELLKLSNYRGSQRWLQMPQAERLSNSLVSPVTFLMWSNICIIRPYLVTETPNILFTKSNEVIF